MDLRKRGARREGRIRQSDSDRADPITAVDAGSPGEIRINSDVMSAISQLYFTSPSIRAARAILQGQLLSSGVVVRRSGNDVPLQEEFSRYLEDVWIPFARKVIDSFLMFGFVVVSIEEEAQPPFAGLRRLRKAAAERAAAVAATGKRRRDAGGNDNALGESADARAKGAKQTQSARDIVTNGVQNVAETIAQVRDSTVNLVPMVPDLNTYTVSWRRYGESNYQREYRVFSTSARNVYRHDEAAEIFFREEPDFAGNICSPVATVFQSASFISALEELALQAEV